MISPWPLNISIKSHFLPYQHYRPTTTTSMPAVHHHNTTHKFQAPIFHSHVAVSTATIGKPSLHILQHHVHSHILTNHSVAITVYCTVYTITNPPPRHWLLHTTTKSHQPSQLLNRLIPPVTPQTPSSPHTSASVYIITTLPSQPQSSITPWLPRRL